MGINGGIEFVDLAVFSKELSMFSDKSLKALLMYSNTKATEIKSYMQKNRPWTDRTGEAKRRLGTAVGYNTGDKELAIALYHGVSYGIDLEMKHECRYAIILPTIRHYSPIIMNDLQEIFNDI